MSSSKLFPELVLKPWQIGSLLLLPALFWGLWQGIIKPHEIKRLHVEAAAVANHVEDGFSSHLHEDLNLISQTFRALKQQTYGTQASIIDALNEQFGLAPAIEAFVLPPVGEDSALVFFNPYVMYPKVLLAKTRCMQALNSAVKTKDLQHYQNLILLPIEDAMCVYDASLDTFAVLNLKTAISTLLQGKII